MANKNEITKGALYEMVKKELVNFAKKKTLQEEKAKLQAELNQLNEVMAGSEMDKNQDYHAGQKEPVFDVKGTHLTEEGEGDISSPDQVKSDGDLDKYIQNLVAKGGGEQSVSEGDGEEISAPGDVQGKGDLDSYIQNLIAKGGGSADKIANSIDSNQEVAEVSGLGEAEINEGLENAIQWEGDIAKLYDLPIAKMENGEIVFTDPDGEKALSKHVGVLKAKYDAAQGGDTSMVAEDEEIVDGEIEEFSSESIEEPGSEMLPEWLKEELDEMEDDSFSIDDSEEVFEIEDMGMYEMEEVSGEEVIEEEDVEEEVDLEKIQESVASKMTSKESKEIIDTVKEKLNEGKDEGASLLSESFRARMQRLAGM